MNILFLDDMIERWEIFKEVSDYGGHTTQWVKTAEEAVEALTDKSFDIVFLDHDLSYEHYVAKDGDYGSIKTGQYVADYIAEELLQSNMPKYVIIHSMNPVGSKNMRQSLLKRYTGLNLINIPFNPISIKEMLI